MSKTADNELATIQVLTLDAVGSLAYMYFLNNHDNEGFVSEEANEKVWKALHLMGNTSANILWLRCKRFLKALNPKRQDMVEKTELFEPAAPPSSDKVSNPN